MSTTWHPHEDLIAHLAGRSSGSVPGEAARVVADVLAFFAEPVEDTSGGGTRS